MAEDTRTNEQIIVAHPACVVKAAPISPSQYHGDLVTGIAVGIAHKERETAATWDADRAALLELGGCVLPTVNGLRAALEWLARQEGVRSDWYSEEASAILEIGRAHV